MEIRGEGPKIPEELQRKVCEALFELCIFIHENAGPEQVLLTINHVSNARDKHSSTIATIMGSGPDIRKTAESSAPKNKEEVNNLINELMAKAKAKGAEKKTDSPKTEPPAPDTPPNV